MASTEPKPNRTGRRTRIPTVLILVLAALGILVAYVYLSPPAPCCAPGPAPGTIFLRSYNFQTSGSNGSLFVVIEFPEGQNVTIQQVYFDQTLLTLANSDLNTACSSEPVAQYAYTCTVNVSFSPTFPAPSTGSSHTLEVVASTGARSSFSVTAGTLYEATTTAASQRVTVSGTVFQGCVGSMPLSVTFKDESGNSFTANVETAGSSWTYSISLTGGYTYKVSVSYKPVVPLAIAQTSDAGSLVLGADSTTTYNIPC